MGESVVLVATKLHVPEPRPGLVDRRALLDRLAGGGDRRLTLVCAPAGWGKTLVLAGWQASDTRPFAWVSLDEADDDPARFWSYVVAAVRTVAPGVGEAALASAATAGAAFVETGLPTLINELAELREPVVLVLDDYHVVHDELVHDAVAYLLRHAPRTLHLAIATRADPPLPLGRLRAAGEVLELRAAELRFSEREAGAMLNDGHGLGLGADEVRLLQERTEGWPAGLQLAALSLRDRSDRSAFVRAFAGDDRQIGEYLHEVLEELDAPVREFLLRTSILERLCAPLCDAVCETADSAARLAEAYRSNLFLVALDERGHWFRYHRLFRDLLRGELARGEPGADAALHRRAFAWHRANGDVHEAIVHATAAGEVAAAAELIARHSQPGAGATPRTVARWIDALPAEAVRADPRLCLARGWMSYWLGRPEEVEGWLQRIDGAIALHGHDGMAAIEMSATLLRSALEYQRGDVGRFAAVVERALGLAAYESFPAGSLASTVTGLARYFGGDPGGAVEALEAARRTAPAAGWAQLRVPAHAALGAARADLGQLDGAEAATDEAERLLAEFSLTESATASLVHVARAKLLELRGDLAGAAAELVRAAQLARRSGWRLDLAHALVLLAGLRRRRGEFDLARACARDARAAVEACRDPGVLGARLAREERALQLAPPAPGAVVLDGELSERELAVLRLLATELSQREIGAELYVSLNTVKSHTRNVFRKLGVASRPDAVARARELGLI